MSKMKKVCAALLTASLFASLTGCSSGNGASGSSSGSTSSSTPSSKESSVSSTSSASTPASSDTGAKKSNEERYATLPNPNITIYGKEKGADAGFDKKVETFESKYGGKVTVLLEKEDPENVMKAIAAGTPPDMVGLSNNRQADYLSKAMLKPLDDLLDVTDPVFEKAYSSFGTWRGKVYAVGPMAMQKAIVYNKTMFENNGIKTPVEYVKEGKWDFATMIELAKSLTLDTNNDGTIDQWGFGAAEWAYPIAQMNGGGVYRWNHQEPAVDVVVNTPQTIEALQMYQDALLKEKCFTYTADNRKAFMDSSIAMVFETMGTMNNFKKNMDVDVDIAPFPAGPNGDPMMQPTAMSRYGVPAAAKNPEGGAAWLYLEALGKEADYDSSIGKLFEPDRWAELKKTPYNYILSEDMFTSALLSEANKKFDEDFRAGVPIATIVASVEPMYKKAIEEWLTTEAAAWDNANK